jgi:hypothetical protein
MRDGLRHLDREPKAVRHGRGPALVRRRSMRAMERRVDLGGTETVRVSCEMAADPWKARRI